jgi:predicted DNA-binding transcriptional regulator AlpA
MPKPTPTPERLLSAHDVARRLQVSISTFWRLRAADQAPPAVKIGGVLRWRPDDVEAWIADQRDA